MVSLQLNLDTLPKCCHMFRYTVQDIRFHINVHRVQENKPHCSLHRMFLAYTLDNPPIQCHMSGHTVRGIRSYINVRSILADKLHCSSLHTCPGDTLYTGHLEKYSLSSKRRVHINWCPPKKSSDKNVHRSIIAPTCKDVLWHPCPSSVVYVLLTTSLCETGRKIRIA